MFAGIVHCERRGFPCRRRGEKEESERGRGEKENGESVGVGRPERRRLGRATSTLIGFYS